MDPPSLPSKQIKEDTMLSRKATGTVCILLLVGAMASSCTCPTGLYEDTHRYLWQLTTIGGIVTGTILHTPSCDGDFLVTGTTIGTDVTLHVENTNPDTACCNPVDFEATAYYSYNCSEMRGSYTFPPDSNCSGSGSLVWRLIDSAQQPAEEVLHACR